MTQVKCNTSTALIAISVIFFSWILIGCATSGGGTSGSNLKVENKVTSNQALTLEDFLRRLNGVQVKGTGNNLQIAIRGNMSISNANKQPLFVLDGQEIGDSYTEVASLVNRGDIISVEAIPAARASQYGIQGGSGVIVIKTRK